MCVWVAALLAQMSESDWFSSTRLVFQYQLMTSKNCLLVMILVLLLSSFLKLLYEEFFSTLAEADKDRRKIKDG